MMRFNYYQKLAIFVTVLCTLSSAETVLASLTIGVTPSADAFVSAAQPDSNYGAAGALAISAAGLPNGEFISLLRFDTAAAKSSFDAAYGVGQWTVASVGLRLTAIPPNNAIFNSVAAGQFNATWMENDSWIEGSGTPAAPAASGITFNTLPSFEGPDDSFLGSFVYGGATSGAQTYALGLPSGLTDDLLAGDLVGLKLDAADAVVSYLFNSRNFGTAVNRPELILTAAPEPGSLSILALGIISVGLLRRH